MKLKLNDKITIDLPKLIESRLLVQANSGGGKSWAIRRIVEEAFGHVQIIILDPEGEFSNLRSKFDFVYVGKGGDAPAEPRAAALLAKRLLELKASAIIDLYELTPQERKHFVRLFCEAMVNAPKELWHDALVIIDEAHVFAPEKGESEAMGSVIDLATRGRKRGYCVVLATQRLPKLNKDAAAECNKKLIGRASQDIDRKRASEELGFTTKEQILSLRDLDPGEFYIFGPATGTREVTKITIGTVQVKPAKRGVSRARPPAPSSAVKKILSQLKDLPQEAQKEAQTTQELKAEITRLKRGAVDFSKIPKHLLKEEYDRGYGEAEYDAQVKAQQQVNKFKESIRKKLLKTHGNVKMALDLLWTEIEELAVDPTDDMMPIPFSPKKLENEQIRRDASTGGQVLKASRQTYDKKYEIKEPLFEEKPLSKGARQVLAYLQDVYPASKSKAQIWVATGYAPGGGFNNMLYELTGMIEKDSTGRYVALVGQHSNFDTSLDKWDSKVSAGARKLFRIFREDPDTTWPKEELASRTGYALGGGFNNMIYELTGKELVVKVGAEYKINPEILDL